MIGPAAADRISNKLADEVSPHTHTHTSVDDDDVLILIGRAFSENSFRSNMLEGRAAGCEGELYIADHFCHCENPQRVCRNEEKRRKKEDGAGYRELCRCRLSGEMNDAVNRNSRHGVNPDRDRVLEENS